jgi:ferrous iron transport protein A
MNEYQAHNCTLDKIKPGNCAIIIGFEEDSIPLKLLEMGLLPGNTVKVKRIAPLKDPIHITVSGYDLALRADEARFITVQPLGKQTNAV